MVTVPISLVLGVLGLLGFQRVSGSPASDVRDTVIRLEVIVESIAKNQVRMGDTFDKFLKLYADQNAEIGIMENRIGRTEKDLEKINRVMENRWHDPVGGGG